MAKNTDAIARLVLFAICTCVWCCVCSADAWAQAAIGTGGLNTDNILDSVVDEYRLKAMLWRAAIVRFARGMFWILAAIEYTYTLIEMVLKGGDFRDLLEALLKRVLTIGFFYALLENSFTWANVIITSFRDAADKANSLAGGVQGLSPSEVFDSGIALSLFLTQGVSILKPGSSLGIIIASYILIGLFSLIAARLLVVLVKMYVMLHAGIITLGFGGSRWTQSAALEYLSLTASVGVELFMTQLIIGAGMQFILKWSQMLKSGTNNGSTLVMMGCAVVFYVLIKELPAMVAALVPKPGAVTNGNPLISSASTMGNSAVMAASSVPAALGAVHEAHKLSADQRASGKSILQANTPVNLARHASQHLGGPFSLSARLGNMRQAMQRQRNTGGSSEGGNGIKGGS